jgi:hypothetical protein
VIDPLFVSDGDTYVPTEYARSPWGPDSLHGGPPAALLARAVEHHEVDQPMLLARLTVEILRPVPMEPFRVTTRTVRPGKKVQLIESVLSTGEHDICRAWGWRIRVADIPMPDEVDRWAAPAPPVPDQQPPTFPAWGWRAFHGEGVEMRWVGGRFDTPGPATVWIRMRGALVDDEPVTGVQRVAATADFGNGVSRVLPMDDYLFINPDLTVYVYREPVGEWVCLDAHTHHGRTGVGLAETAIYDSEGRVGRGTQSLLLDRR